MATASATVVGSLDLDGGAVTVSATNLVWNGFAVVNGITTLTYDSGTAVPGGTDVTLANLPGSLPTPINDFMTFNGIPMLDFTLNVAGPGSANTDCSTTGLAANGGYCSAFMNSPLLLSQGTDGTVVSLGVSGTVSDGTGGTSTWSGEFSETIASLTEGQTVIVDPSPAQIQAYFGGPLNPNSNTLTTTYQGTFVAEVVSMVGTPEPSSALMMLLGTSLVLAGIAIRHHSRP